MLGHHALSVNALSAMGADAAPPAGRLHRASGLDGLAGAGQERFNPLLALIFWLVAIR